MYVCMYAHVCMYTYLTTTLANWEAVAIAFDIAAAAALSVTIFERSSQAHSTALFCDLVVAIEVAGSLADWPFGRL